MCGIAGIIHWGAGDPDALPRVIDAMVTSLAHRGPDAQGSSVGSVAALGHARLSIIDLTSEANQPMSDASGRWHLVYNGEVYNYIELRNELVAKGWVFRTKSDTEVVLAALVMWGRSAVRRFNGMWALALVDEQEQTVLLSRDRFGVKPLFLHVGADGRVIFASEVKALLAADPSLAEVDDSEVARFLYRSALGEGSRTLYRRVDRLLPGHDLLIKQDGRKACAYWKYPERMSDPPSFEEACEEFRSLLEDAVRLRLRSDVPVATTLSGGLDSSAIATLVHRLGVTDHMTYTASFPGESFDEGEAGAKLSSRLGFRSHLITEQVNRLDVDVFANIVHHMDGPTLNPTTLPLWGIMSAVQEDGIKVVLEGQGADELLGGYTNQVAFDGALDSLATVGTRQAALDLGDFVRNWGVASVASWIAHSYVPGAHAFYRRFFGVRRFVGARVRYLDVGDYSWGPVRTDDSRVNDRLRWQHVTLLRPLLDFGDRISMAHGVETRLPFMDYRLVEFVSALPGRYKVQGGSGKVLEREALRSLLPGSVLDARKLGFVAPVNRWFSGPPGRELLERVADGIASRSGYVDAASVRGVPAEVPMLTATSLFRLLGLELWLQDLDRVRRTPAA